MAAANSSVLATKVELHLSCVGLKKLDLLSKSDPFVVVYNKDPKDLNSPWTEYFRTTTLENNHNPEWPDQIVLSYRFEAMQELRFEVYDRDSKSEKLSAHDFVGAYETSMSEIMGRIGCTQSGFLTKKGKKKPMGKIIITGQEMATTHDMAIFQFKASKLDKKNMMGFGKSDPFYEISQSKGSTDGEEKFIKVFTSEFVKSNVNPTWKKQQLATQVLVNGQLDKRLKFDIYDWESNGKHKFIGSFITTLEELLVTKQYTLKNLKAKKQKDRDKSRGLFEVKTFEIKKIPTFLDYIQGGLEINLQLAVDFTGSNGNPKSSTSLHFLKSQLPVEDERNVDPDSLNQYELAIWSVGRILQDYDDDKLIPSYGFGGVYKDKVSHCFPLNHNDNNAEVFRVKGILEAYKKSLVNVRLSGPTLFGKILDNVIGFSEELSADRTKQKYCILLILTDGVINDMEKTIQKLIEGSSLPLSVIIVGVGNADFKMMEQLDADDTKLRLNNKEAKRDLVQFVPFNEFYKRGPTVLAEEVLKEIPQQVVEYFNDIKLQQPYPPQEPPKEHFVDNLEDVPLAEEVKE